MLTVADFKEFNLPTIIQQRIQDTDITSYIADFSEDKDVKVIVIKPKFGNFLYYFAYNSTDAATDLIETQLQSLEDLVTFLNLSKTW